jgi:hypothetical protein
MRHQSSLAAIAVVLVATSIRPADARQERSFVQSAGCGAAVMGSEAGDAHSFCVHPSAARKRVRLGRSSESRRPQVSRSGVSCGGTLSAVRARSGATACVASNVAARFQAFVSDLESTGYRIDFMGGWRRHGSCRQCNMHPRGLAIDINQTGRNRVTRRLPAGVTAMAERHGLLHGAVWANADAGHFELLSASPTRYAYARRRPMDAYASALPGAVMLARSLSEQGSGHD